jgi:hypothetical protein
MPPNVITLQPKPNRQHKKVIDLANIRRYRQQALADLAEATKWAAARHDGKHDAPFEVARKLGGHLRKSVLTEHDLEAAVKDACAANGSPTPIDITIQIRNGLREASNDGAPLAGIHGVDQSSAPLDQSPSGPSMWAMTHEDDLGRHNRFPRPAGGLRNRHLPGCIVYLGDSIHGDRETLGNTQRPPNSHSGGRGENDPS